MEVTTSIWSRSVEPRAVETCSSSSGSKRLSTTTTSMAGERRHRQPDGVDRAEAGVGDEHHEIGCRARRTGRRSRRRTRSATAARRRSRPNAPQARVDGQCSSAMRSASVNGSSVEHRGGHRRRHRHAVPAVAGTHVVRVLAGRGARARRRRSGRARRRRRTAPACGRRRSRRQPAAAESTAAPTHVLPISVAVPDADDERHRVGERLRQAPSTWSSVWAADSATRSRDVPAGTVGGRMAGTSRPWSSSRRADASRARCSSPSTIGHDRRRVAGRDAFDVRPQPVRRARRPPCERSTRSRGEGGGGVGRRRRGGEDERPRRVDHEVDERARAGDETAERPERLRQRADPQDGRPRRPARSGSERTEHGVGLVEHEQRAVPARTSPRASSSGATSPSIENTVSVTTIAGPSCARSSASTWSTSPWRAISTRAARQPAAVDDRGVVELVADDEHARPWPNVVSTPRLAAKPVGNSSAASASLPRRPARPRARGGSGRPPTIRRADPGARCRTVRGRRAAAARTTAGAG